MLHIFVYCGILSKNYTNDRETVNILYFCAGSGSVQSAEEKYSDNKNIIMDTSYLYVHKGVTVTS